MTCHISRVQSGAVVLRSRRFHAVIVRLLAVLIAVVIPAGSYAGGTGTFLDRGQATDIRVVSWNVQGNLIADGGADAAFARVLNALDPDVIVFEEISSNAVENALAGWLNSSIGNGPWQTFGGISTGVRTVIASRFPMTMQQADTTPASSTRGVTMALINLPSGTYDTDIYLMGVHLKCCGGTSEEESRQRSADAIAKWCGDIRTPGGSINLATNTPVIVIGDMNLVGGTQPATTMLTGDIIDNGTFGADIKGDWDVSNLTDLIPRDPNTNDADTWPSTSSPSSRLDRSYFTDSVLVVPNDFVLNTNTMSAAQRAAAGLNANDTSESATADHLPIAMDLRLVPAEPTGSCCVGTGACSLVSESTCLGVGGLYQGDDTVCAPNPCPQPAGGCCFANGTCALETEEDCDSFGGEFEGDFSVCSPNPCPQPPGACCFMDRSCNQLVVNDCTVLGGVHHGAGTLCGVVDCTPVMGACCLGSTCITLTATDCTAVAGVYLGDGAGCGGACVTETPCPSDCAPDNGDGTFGNGVVNIDDLLSVINDFGAAGGPCDSSPDNGDGTFGNGLVNIDDLLATINAFGACR
jgi:endonuclease/exonuclease/phosphatase family metal-dependent hydrolase